MNYILKSEEKLNYLLISSTGKVDGLADMMAYSGATFELAFSKNAKKILIDEREMVITLSALEQLELMNHFMINFPKSLDLQFSVVYSDNNRSIAEWFADLSLKVGFDCKFFTTKKEAIDHLLG